MAPSLTQDTTTFYTDESDGSTYVNNRPLIAVDDVEIYEDEDDVISFSRSNVRPDIQVTNIMHVCACIVNVGSVYAGFGSELNDNDFDTVIHDKYPTLIQPASYVNGIYYGLVAIQLIFVIIQLHSKYRSHALIMSIGPWYLFSSIFHAVFMLMVLYEYIFAAFLCIFSSYLCLLQIANLHSVIGLPRSISMYGNTNGNESKELEREFASLKFPFRVMYGWSVCLSILSLSMLGDDWNWVQSDMLAVATLSLCFLSVLGYHDLMMGYHRTGYILVSTLIFYCVGIGVELSDPSDAISQKYDDNIIDAFQKSSFWVVAVWGMTLIVNFASLYLRNRFRIEVVRH